jgi:transcriptional regulator GlxA family with amidase domain
MATTTGILLFDDAEELETLRALGDITVVDDQRWVVDGDLVTAAGVSAGIDMALWLVGQFDGEEHGSTVQHIIEYEPQPPYPYRQRR